METCLLCTSPTVTHLACELRACTTCGFFFLSKEERARQQAVFHTVSGQGVDGARLEMLKNKYPKTGHKKRELYAQCANEVVEWFGIGVRVLDVGANGGFFLHELEVCGVKKENLRLLEIDPTYKQLAKDYFGYDGDIANIETYETTQTFHAVVMFDVLEHVDDFWLALTRIRTMLRGDGRLILKLPNGNMARAKYTIARMLGLSTRIPSYLYLEPGGHLNYWNHRSVRFLESAGFTVEQFEYVAPTRTQFGRTYPLRMFAYTIDRLAHTHLFPEFIVVLKKRP